MRTLLTRVIRAPGTAAVHILIGLAGVLLLFAATSPTGLSAPVVLVLLTILAALDLLGCSVLTGLLRLWARWSR